jgi:ubiquinone/menaquinone biosynthesis C-methylase UbiE
VDEDGFAPGGVRAAYAAVVDTYVESFGDDLAALELDRRVLGRVVAGVAPGGFVLDVGCGPGLIAQYLVDAGVAVMGVDLTPEMLVAASRRLRDFRVVAADVRVLPLRAASIAGAVVFYVLQHQPRRALPGTLRELRRVVAPGGMLVAAVHEGHGEIAVGDVGCTLYNERELADHLVGASFRVESIDRRQPLPHEHQGSRLYLVARAVGLSRS